MKKSKDGSKLLGKGTAHQAAKAIKKAKKTKVNRLKGIMNAARQARGRGI